MRAVWAGVLLAACAGETTPDDTGLPTVEPGCVSLAAIEPFQAEVGQEASQVVTLSNPCDADAVLAELTIPTNARDAFRVSLPESARIPAGGSTTATLTFTPTERRTYRAALKARVEGVDEPASVPLKGTGVGPAWYPSVGDVRLEGVLVGCPQSVRVLIHANGEAPVQVSAIGAPGEGWTAVPDIPLPTTVRPGMDLGITVQFDAIAEGTRLGSLRVQSDDRRLEPLEIDLFADAFALEKREDTWNFANPPPIDLLVTVDRSHGMHELAPDVLAGLPGLVATVGANHPDLRVAIAVGDEGCIPGGEPFVDPSFSASAARSTFRTMADLDKVLVPYGSNEERPEVMVMEALSARNIAGCNAGFYRSDATLHTLFATGSVQTSPDTYLAIAREYLVDLKGDPKQVVHHAIVPLGPTPECGRSADGLALLTDARDGALVDLCGDIDAGMATIADNLADRPNTRDRRFLTLSEEPVPETLVVRVNGIPSTAWTYEPVEHRIAFDEDAVPDRTKDVSVAYVVQPFCD